MKYFGTILLGFILSVAMLLGVFFGSLGFSSSANAINIGAWYSHKEDALSARSAPGRIVLIGGSSGLYGVRMADVETALNRPAVNFATHAGLPLRYLLHRARQQLKPGDMAVFAPEYEFYHPGRETDIYVDFVLGEDPEFLDFVSIPEKARWVFGAQAATLVNSVKRWTESAQKHAEDVRQNSRSKLNENGDMVVNDLASRPPARARALESVEDLVSFKASLTYSEESWKEIEEFVQWCHAHSVTLLVAFPPTVFFPVYDRPEYAGRFDELVKKWQSLGVPVLGSPRESMLPMASFYDTVYHLNSDGMTENTRRLIEMLRPMVDDHEN